MIKTVPFDIPLSFLMGMLIPLACPKGIASAEHIVLNRYFLGVMLWELFFMVPLGTYLYFFYPDWSLMFFVDPATMTESTLRIVGASALSFYVAAGAGGFILAAQFIRKEQTSTARIVFMAVLGALLIFNAITMAQLTQVGSYSDWMALPRTTVPIYAHRIGFIVGIDGTAAGVFTILMIRTLRLSEHPLRQGEK